MFKESKSADFLVLYSIQNISQKGFDYFRLNMKEYATFLNEKEVLFCSGKRFKILDIVELEHGSG